MGFNTYVEIAVRIVHGFMINNTSDVIDSYFRMLYTFCKTNAW